MKPFRFFALNVVLGAFAVAPIASAQTTNADKASAEALFNEGASLVDRGRFAAGCAKFEASQELEPTLGTELHLADCYERLGKTASAWALFRESQGLARRQGDSDREQVARDRAEKLVPRLSYLTIEANGEHPPSLVVKRNGRDVPLASLGVAIPVDPGPQEVSASAPSYRSWTGRVEVADGAGTAHLLIPRLDQLPPTPVTTPRPARQADAPAQAAPSSQRAWGIAVTAVGAASILTGVGLGVWARHEYDRSRLDRYCPSDDHNGCTSDGLALRQRAQGFAKASTITVLAGAGVLTTGIVLWSLAPRRGNDRYSTTARLSAMATPSSFGTAIEGAW